MDGFQKTIQNTQLKGVRERLWESLEHGEDVHSIVTEMAFD
jgi:hypothetical protein